MNSGGDQKRNTEKKGGGKPSERGLRWQRKRNLKGMAGLTESIGIVPSDRNVSLVTFERESSVER